ncbi:OmpA family protein [Flavobacterium akiainvivens]|nr:OmpA family protein [Flavobacterium akiainvivens]
MNAQDNESTDGAKEFNKWSIDFGGGVNKTSGPFADPSSYVEAFNFFHAELGFRYMFNTKFGLKLSGTYDVINDKDDKWETNMFGVDVQAYANLGRIMEFETWTKRIGLLGHLGAGINGFETKDVMDDNEWMARLMVGITPQFRISDRVALYGDFTVSRAFDQEHTWDGGVYPAPGSNQQGFDAWFYTASLGLNIYLGGKEQHADWYVYNESDKLAEAVSRIDELEAKMQDTDRDGVPDYLDAEPNTTAGVAVDTKGRSIDKNNNGIPDELESVTQRVDTLESEVRGNGGANGKSVGLKEMINGGYVNVYFDFNKDTPNAQSVSGINFLIKYLKDNPSSTADVIGYADEIGDNAYNNDLSQRRAANVKKVLVEAGIDASRLNIIGNGEDASVDKKSKQARQTVRRVTFKLK